MNEQVLPPLGIFKALSDDQRDHLAAHGRFHVLALGKVLVKQGEQGSELHLLIDGMLEATCQGGGRVLSLGPINKGETIGEMNFFDPLKASASVKAKQSSVLWSIQCADLHTFCKENLDVGITIHHALGVLLARRVRKASDQMLRQAEAALRLYESDD